MSAKNKFHSVCFSFKRLLSSERKPLSHHRLLVPIFKIAFSRQSYLEFRNPTEFPDDINLLCESFWEAFCCIKHSKI